MNNFPVVLRETRDKLLETLNSSGLPIDVLDMLLVQIQYAVHNQAEQEYLKIKSEEEESEVKDGSSSKNKS